MPTENERRFLIISMDKSIMERSKYIDIIQGYFRFPIISLRIRLVREEGIVVKAILGAKNGKGVSREENEKEININVGKLLFRMCFCHLAKRRYLPEGTDWTIDSFGYPLEGETVEIELKNKNQEFQFPSWIYEAVEITDSISSRDLAKLATKLRKNKSPCALVSLL